MASQHLDIYHLTRRDDFRHRIQTSVYLTARNILNEQIPDGLEFAPRYNLARQATALDTLTLEKFVWACAANSTIAGAELATDNSSADGDLDFVVSAAWDQIAGA